MWTKKATRAPRVSQPTPFDHNFTHATRRIDVEKLWSCYSTRLCYSRRIRVMDARRRHLCASISSTFCPYSHLYLSQRAGCNAACCVLRSTKYFVVVVIHTRRNVSIKSERVPHYHTRLAVDDNKLRSTSPIEIETSPLCFHRRCLQLDKPTTILDSVIQRGEVGGRLTG